MLGRCRAWAADPVIQSLARDCAANAVGIPALALPLALLAPPVPTVVIHLLAGAPLLVGGWLRIRSHVRQVERGRLPAESGFVTGEPR